MTKENQAVTAEVTRLGAERDDSRRKLGDALHNQATAEQVSYRTHRFGVCNKTLSEAIAHLSEYESAIISLLSLRRGIPEKIRRM